MIKIQTGQTVVLQGLNRCELQVCAQCVDLGQVGHQTVANCFERKALEKKRTGKQRATCALNAKVQYDSDEVNYE